MFNDFPLETTHRKMTFAGVLSNFWDEISRNNSWNENTCRFYMTQYRNILLPKTLKYCALSDYEENDFIDLINEICKGKDYSESTIRHYRHLIKVVVDAGVNHDICLDVLNCTAFDLPDDSLFNVQNRHLLRVRKSLNVEQNIFIASLLLSDPETISGEELGLLLMFMLGLRNNEAAAVTYSDIKPIPGYPGIWCLYISKSTKEKSTDKKASGKTPNSPRILPMPSILSSFLLARRAFVEKQYYSEQFDHDGTTPIFGIDGLLLACHGNKYNTACQADDLGRRAKILFQNVPGFDPDSLRILDLERIQSEPETGIVEKEPTAYLFRHNFATMLFNLGFENHEVQYYIGHDIEHTELIRNDFVNPEILYHLWQLIEFHPINFLPLDNWVHIQNCPKRTLDIPQSKASICLKSPLSQSSMWLVSITAQEPNQTLDVSLENREYLLYQNDDLEQIIPSSTVNIRPQLVNVYLEKIKKMKEHNVI